jgi:nicotinamidase/pyrazinamidase
MLFRRLSDNCQALSIFLPLHFAKVKTTSNQAQPSKRKNVMNSIFKNHTLDISDVGNLYEPDFQSAYEHGVADFRAPASGDSPRVLAWLIDVQVDFVFPAPIGRLPVPNAVEDTKRTIEWLYRNTHQITQIAASLDTHTPFQIFYPTWWKNSKGDRPAPYTVISAEDVRKGIWTPITEPVWSVKYLETLEQVGKKQLMIWPFHCMEGTSGRALVPALSEAIMYHSGARMAQPTYLTKGTIAHTEFYSVVEPEVKYAKHPDGGLNTRFLEMVAQFDLIYVAGQARSHCVLETMNSVVRHFASSPDVIRKLRFMDDCTSSISGFEQPTEAALSRFAAQGVKMVKSSDTIG